MTSLNEVQSEHEPLLIQEVEKGSYGSVAVADEKVLDDTNVKRQGSYSQLQTPLPWKQLLVVFVMRLAEPIAYSQVFPYVNEMMEEVGAVDDPKEAGYYSGITESAFAVAELLTVMRWGSLSDQLGRKPVLLMGFAGATLSTLLFGLSKSFSWALTTRFLAGGLSGNLAVLLSAVGDMTDETNQARAYAIFGVANNVAQMAGPSIGGAFANPVVTFPESFGRIFLFQEFPYLLPCAISALITLIATCCGAAFFKDTRRKEPPKAAPTDAAHSHSFQSTTWSIATAPLLLSVLTPFFLLSVLNTSFVVVFALFAYTPMLSGGLSRDPEEIGFAIATAGVIGAIIQVVILPELQLRYGSLSLYRFFMSLWPVIYMLFPAVNAIARYTMQGTDKKDYGAKPAGLAVWSIAIILLSLARLASMAYSLNLILTKNACPSAAVLGRVFALSQFVNCVARAFAPAFVSSLFALSEEQNLFNGNFVWVVMCFISFIGVWATLQTRDGSSESHE